MESFYETLVAARKSGKDSNQQFVKCMQDIFVNGRAEFCYAMEQMKEHLILQAKQNNRCLTVEHRLDIESVFTTLDWWYIPIDLPESYHPSVKNVTFYNEYGGNFPNQECHDLTVRYICEHVPEVGEWLKMLRETFDKADIDCSITNNEGKTRCFFVLKVSYRLED